MTSLREESDAVFVPRPTTVAAHLRPRRHEVGPLRIQFAMVLLAADLTDSFGTRVLRLLFLAPPRDNPGGAWEELTMMETVPREITDDALPDFIRHVIHSMIAHEVDEGLTLAKDGTRPWDPHKAEQVEVTAVDPETRTVTVRGVKR